MTHNRPTRKYRRAMLGVVAVGSIIAVSGALADGRLLLVFALAATFLAVLGEATGLGERSAVVKRLTGVSALVGLVLAAIVFYMGVVS